MAALVVLVETESWAFLRASHSNAGTSAAAAAVVVRQVQNLNVTWLLCTSTSRRGAAAAKTGRQRGRRRRRGGLGREGARKLQRKMTLWLCMTDAAAALKKSLEPCATWCYLCAHIAASVYIKEKSLVSRQNSSVERKENCLHQSRSKTQFDWCILPAVFYPFLSLGRTPALP